MYLGGKWGFGVISTKTAGNIARVFVTDEYFQQPARSLTSIKRTPEPLFK
jgi:hypothetical protein